MSRCKSFDVWSVGVLLLIAFALGGCFGDGGALRCEDMERYGSSQQIPPLRIPDALTVPDETDALRVPDRSIGGAELDPDLPCMELPPDFFEGEAEG